MQNNIRLAITKKGHEVGVLPEASLAETPNRCLPDFVLGKSWVSRDTKGSGHESALYAPLARTNGELKRPELNSHFAGV